jgi:hypothetical protein
VEGQLARKRLRLAQNLDDAIRVHRQDLESALTGSEGDELLRIVYDRDVRRLREGAEGRLQELERTGRDTIDHLRLLQAEAMGRS